ncbi:MAG TPA: cytochrome c maturation protein CcmE [Alphaproteobacteria bacterium]|nr:cytochrome c maturation protein CcmE [Alphaproteobacteria bacterium]
MTRKRRRMMLLGLCLLGLGTATALALTAFQDNLLFFYSPTDLVERQMPPDQRFRLGGLVAEGSVDRLADGITVRFAVTDTAHTLPVTYKGILPDLFREGQGVVAQGQMGPDGVFQADEVLAKHDENYRPPEIDEALKSADEFRARAAGTLTSETGSR